MSTQHENCTEMIDELMAQTLCKEPIAIAEALGIIIKRENLPCSLIGMYTEIATRCFIVLNDSDDDDMQQYVVALCLYYYLKRMPRYLLRSGPADGNFDAARFAYALLTHNQEAPDPKPVGYEAFEEASGIPRHIIEMAKRRLN